VFDHLDIAVSDLEASRRFYSLALGDATPEPTAANEWLEWGDFGITPVTDDHPLTQHLHVAFATAGRDAVDGWWRRMVDAGYTSDGEPGPRPQYSAGYYGAFVLDPDGNSVESVHKEDSEPGQIDHVWFRTTDLTATRRFYGTIAPNVGIELRADESERLTFGFSDRRGSFTFVRGDQPSVHVHFAFGVNGQDAVAAFHETATAAGYLSNGGPGERPEYHAGYYGAFVFDPNSHNVEAVFHDRR